MPGCLAKSGAMPSIGAIKLRSRTGSRFGYSRAVGLRHGGAVHCGAKAGAFAEKLVLRAASHAAWRAKATAPGATFGAKQSLRRDRKRRPYRLPGAWRFIRAVVGRFTIFAESWLVVPAASMPPVPAFAPSAIAACRSLPAIFPAIAAGGAVALQPGATQHAGRRQTSLNAPAGCINFVPATARTRFSAPSKTTRAIASLPPGVNVGLTVNRDDHVTKIPVVLDRRPAQSGG